MLQCIIYVAIKAFIIISPYWIVMTCCEIAIRLSATIDWWTRQWLQLLSFLRLIALICKTNNPDQQCDEQQSGRDQSAHRRVEDLEKAFYPDEMGKQKCLGRAVWRLSWGRSLSPFLEPGWQRRWEREKKNTSAVMKCDFLQNYFSFT